ncbi:rhodanese-like domain-containing protein [Clostridiaceae bacterium M8S5]|nr:rhodanese-like domain-containing protein [Clostridiaceae bacterium M8S5]
MDTVEKFNTIKTNEVVKALSDNEWIIVDTRLNDAYNGWKLDGVSRGGRIKGAIDFSANWLKVEAEDTVLAETLEIKGITKAKNVILYDANGKDAKEVYKYLKNKGFDKLYIYDIKEWADDEKLALEKYENYELIVPAVVVKEIIDGKKPETFEDAENIKIVEASWGEEKTSYAKGHIPTSFHINTDIIEPPTKEKPIMWMLASDDELKKFALNYGFTKDDTVILTSEEPLASYRVATVLKYIGVKDVRVLNGGTLSWTLAGYELEKTSNKPAPVTDFGRAIPGNPDVIDTMDEVKIGLKSKNRFILVDNRTWKEHIGEISGYSYHDKKGRIPGSVYGHAGKENSYSMEYFRNVDKTMRNGSEFTKLWQEQGIDLKKHLSFMCGSGWRASEIYTYANVYGLKDTAVYSDGWIGWSNVSENPVEMGNPNNED